MVLLLMLVLIAVASTRGLPSCPPGGSYFDEHTNRRECCAGICEHADDATSREHCKLKCPGYDSETNFRANNGNGVLKEAGSDPQLPAAPPPNPTDTPEGQDDDGGSEKVVIIGAVVGVIAVVAVSGVLIAVVIIRLRRKGGSNDTKLTKLTKSPIYKQVAKVDNSHS